MAYIESKSIVKGNVCQQHARLRCGALHTYYSFPRSPESIIMSRFFFCYPGFLEALLCLSNLLSCPPDIMQTAFCATIGIESLSPSIPEAPNSRPKKRYIDRSRKLDSDTKTPLQSRIKFSVQELPCPLAGNSTVPPSTTTALRCSTSPACRTTFSTRCRCGQPLIGL